MSGTIIGSLTNTQSSDNSYQSLTELRTGGRPNTRISYLEHKWLFEIPANNSLVFVVEAHRTSNTENDNFIFAYSTNGENGTYINMLTVTKTTDNNTSQSFVLPANTSGTIHVRVLDTDRSGGNSSQDILHIDRMYFLTQAGPIMETVPDVVGLTQTTAELNIGATSLAIGTVTTQYSETVSAGNVISQNPVSGVSVEQGSDVDLVVSLGKMPDYQVWQAQYPGADLNDEAADLDGDGINNGDERLWGLDPRSAASANPISNCVNLPEGTFTYTRRDPSLTGASYTIWTSSTMAPGSWARDDGAVQEAGATDPDGVQTVTVTLSSGLLISPRLFFQIIIQE